MKEYALTGYMHQLYCSVIVDNTMSVKLFKGFAGFKQIGVRKDWCLGMDIFRCYRISILNQLNEEISLHKFPYLFLSALLCVYIYHQIFSSLKRVIKLYLFHLGRVIVN